MKRTSSRILAIGLGVDSGVVVTLGPLATTGPASAITTTCLNSNKTSCYARGKFNDGSQWGGGYVQVEIATISSSSSIAYLNEELWVSTNTGTSDWVEIGYSYNQSFCPGKALRWFLFYKNPSTTHGACFGSTPSIGTSHTLEVQENTANTWYIYLDGSKITIDTGTGSGWNRTDRTGLEYRDASYDRLSGNAYFSYNEMRNKTCCRWSYWDQGGAQATYPSLFGWTWTSTNPWIHGYDT